MGDYGMPDLTLPRPELVVRGETMPQVRCLVRRRFIRLTPEEWVRQHMLGYVIGHKGYPPGLISVERGHRYQEMARRTDALAHDRSGKPLLLIECKAPDVRIDQAAFDQASRYNLVSRAPLIAISNGIVHFCYRVDPDGASFDFLGDVPDFPT